VFVKNLAKQLLQLPFLLVIVGFFEPFLFQIVTLPFLVIGLGVVIALFARKVIISRLMSTTIALVVAPIVTFILIISFNYWSLKGIASNGNEINTEYLSTWSIILPTLSFITICCIILYRNWKEKSQHAYNAS
jgi:hypothetical protein